MIEKKRFAPIVKDTFPITDGIFSNMEYELPMDGSQMDLLFFSDFGLKTVAPLVLNVMGVEEELTTEQIGVLASLLLNKNKNKWDRYSALLNQEYDPLHNYLDEYSESGTENIDKSDSRVLNDSYTEGINADNTSTRTDNLSEGSTGTFSNTDTGSSSESRYGMNSNTGSIPVRRQFVMLEMRTEVSLKREAKELMLILIASILRKDIIEVISVIFLARS